MKKLIAFFEIPAADFHRAIDFYETVLNMKLPTEGDEFVGAVSYASDFLPSEKGVLIHFNVDEIEPTLETILKKGGKVVIPRTKIEAEGRGYFAVFVDTEGNRVGIYADK